MQTRFDRTVLKTSRARKLRRNATDVEAKLWRTLRRDQLGVSFRRQHPVGPYVLDFFCPSRAFAVELDGGQHAEAQKPYDEKRTHDLNDLGISVRRFWNNDVVDNLDGVLQVIVADREVLAMTPTRRIRADLPLSGGGGASN